MIKQFAAQKLFRKVGGTILYCFNQPAYTQIRLIERFSPRPQSRLLLITLITRDE